jgi:hypothetical protein
MLALVLAAFVSSCGSDSASDPNGKGGNASWTYMVYLAANNSLSPYAKMDINEMEEVGSSDLVKVVVEAEFNKGNTTGVPEQTVRGLVSRDQDQEHMGSWYSSIGDRDMADPATLREFIVWAAQAYPSDHYALVLWSHGMGWKDSSGSAAQKGMITDGPSTTTMTIPEIAQAIRDSGVYFEVINFDACLMGMYEVAYELRGTASYILFSEEEYPANGDPYADVLRDLTQSPSMDGRHLTQSIASECLEFYQDADITVTKSAVDMAMIEELNTDLQSLARYLVINMGSLKPMVEQARDEAFAYDYPTNIDLGDFLLKLHDLTGDAVLQGIIEQITGSGTSAGILSQLVVENDVYEGSGDASNHGITGSRGIAIYLPSSDPMNDQINAYDLNAYSGLACNQSLNGTTWIEFLRSFLLP